MNKMNLTRNILLGLALGVSGSLMPDTAQAVEFTEYNYMGNGGKLNTTYSPLDVINAQAAYDQGYTGKDVTVGVNDTGVDSRHVDLADKSNLCLPSDWPEGESVDKWFDAKTRNDHGTHVAGIIAARKNGTGMHGVAYDASISALCGKMRNPNDFSKGNYFVGDNQENIEVFKLYWADEPSIKIINNSWGTPNKTIASLDNASTFDQAWAQFATGTAGKLMVFSAGNAGTFGPSISAFAYLNPKYTDAKNNIINVGNLSANVQRVTDGDNASITGISKDKNLIGSFSNLALGDEENYILGIGTNIWSTSANTTDKYVSKTGTSMAAPSVSGVGALVQQAFPYLNGKQIGDVLLSTANKNVDFASAGNSQYTYSQQVDGNKNTYYDIKLFFPQKTQALDISTVLANKGTLDWLKGRVEAGKEVYINTFTDIAEDASGMTGSMIGQGVVDAGKAVKGLAQLNARRLTNSDYSSNYTTDGSMNAGGQAIYTVDTQGYDSTWSNDISEVRVDKLSADSSQQDLRNRYNYYTTGKYTKYLLNIDGTYTKFGEYTLAQDGEYADYLQKSIQNYNGYVDSYQSNIINVPVGLKKTGEGILTLSGENSYQGATIVDNGTLNIAGSIAGDAYAEKSGIMNINGYVNGNVINDRALVNCADGSIRGSVINDGRMNVTGMTDVSGDINSRDTLNVTGALYSTGESSKINIAALNGNNTGKFYIDAANVGSDGAGERINIAKATNIDIYVSADGATSLDKANSMDDATANVEENGVGSLVDLGDGASLNIGEGMVYGETSYVNNGNGEGVQRTAKANTANEQTASAIYAAAAFNRLEINDIRKRMGDVRLTNAPDGIWTRLESGQLEGRGIKNGFHKYQIGTDHKVSDKWRIGGAFSYTTGNTTYDRGTNNTDIFSLAAYGLYTGQNGEYADIIGRVGVDNIDVDFYAGSAWAHQHGKLNTASMALSGEIGKTYMLKNHLFLEPQAELMYTHSTGDSFNSNSINYDLSSMDSLQGRLGVALGYQAPDKSGAIYTRLSALHEFAGNRSVNVSSDYGATRNYIDGGHTWWEWSIGGQINLSKATYIYADVEKTWGATVDEKYRATVGLRYSF